MWLSAIINYPFYLSPNNADKWGRVSALHQYNQSIFFSFLSANGDDKINLYIKIVNYVRHRLLYYIYNIINFVSDVYWNLFGLC